MEFFCWIVSSFNKSINPNQNNNKNRANPSDMWSIYLWMMKKKKKTRRIGRELRRSATYLQRSKQVGVLRFKIIETYFIQSTLIFSETWFDLGILQIDHSIVESFGGGGKLEGFFLSAVKMKMMKRRQWRRRESVKLEW